MLRFKVCMNDFPRHQHQGYGRGAENVIRNLSLIQAWHVAHRLLRRGARLYGWDGGKDAIVLAPWGGRAGWFPHRYRSVTIQLDTRPAALAQDQSR